MAMDKNYIDRTDFEVLQPAIDYYYENGTPDEKLRTYYYQGRIYQNKGDNDLSMKAFINARELKDVITDTLTFANLLVAQATHLYSSYKITEFIDNNLLATKLYQTIDHPYYHTKSPINALDGSIISKNKQLADSILIHCQNNIEKHQSYKDIILPYLISYNIVFGSDEEIRDIINFARTNNKQSDVTKLDIAFGYSKIGEAPKALQVLESMHTESADTNSLKYLSIKAEILEVNGKYKDALNYYKLY